MNSLGVIGCMVGGGVLGFMAGAYWPVDGPDDFQFGRGMAMFTGLLIGGAAGTVVGAVVFA